MIGISMLSTVMYMSLQSVDMVRSSIKTVSSGYSADKLVASIVENARGNLESFRINYEYYDSTKIETLLADDKLTNAWDINTDDASGNCQSCDGRYGFVVQPLEELRGMYVLSIRVIHKKWGSRDKKYKFILSAR